MMWFISIVSDKRRALAKGKRARKNAGQISKGKVFCEHTPSVYVCKSKRVVNALDKKINLPHRVSDGLSDKPYWWRFTERIAITRWKETAFTAANSVLNQYQNMPRHVFGDELDRFLPHFSLAFVLRVSIQSCWFAHYISCNDTNGSFIAVSLSLSLSLGTFQYSIFPKSELMIRGYRCYVCPWSMSLIIKSIREQ